MMNIRNKQGVSIRAMILSLCVAFTFLAISISCILIFTNWRLSTSESVKKTANKANTEIYRDIEDFLGMPLHINEVNQKLISIGFIQMEDTEEREKYFVSVLQTHKEGVDSFSYGSETGEYYGARKNQHGEIEIMRNNAETGGESWYFEVNDDLTAGDLVVNAGPFDPRTRDWYKAAKESGGPTFSPIYRHFSVQDLTISASWPIYNNQNELQGVLGTHITLSRVNQHLRSITDEINGKAVIVEKETGFLIANSFEKPNFIETESGSITRIKIDEIEYPALVEGYAHYRKTNQAEFLQKSNHDRYYININEYTENGVSWLVITAVPESYFLNALNESINSTIILVILAVFFSIYIYLSVTKRLLHPVAEIVAAADMISSGDLTKRVQITQKNELGTIAHAFNSMADRLHLLVNDLEKAVDERTAELQREQEQIRYLSKHDSLTGLINRRSFEETVSRLDTEENLPLAVVFADLNGLKLTNDVLGHAAGDQLIVKAADALKYACSDKDYAARVGGDEFILLLPRSSDEEAERVISRIREVLAQPRSNELIASLAMGFDIKWTTDQEIARVIEYAENRMYKDKAATNKELEANLLRDLANALQEKSKELSLLSNLPGMAYRCDYDPYWTMQYVSQGCFEITGYEPEDLIDNKKLSFSDIIAPEYRDVLWTEWDRVLTLHIPFRYEYEIITATGIRKWVLETGQGVFDENGNVEALEGIIVDVSERKERDLQIQYLFETK